MENEEKNKEKIFIFNFLAFNRCSLYTNIRKGYLNIFNQKLFYCIMDSDRCDINNNVHFCVLFLIKLQRIFICWIILFLKTWYKNFFCLNISVFCFSEKERKNTNIMHFIFCLLRNALESLYWESVLYNCTKIVYIKTTTWHTRLPPFYLVSYTIMV